MFRSVPAGLLVRSRVARRLLLVPVVWMLVSLGLLVVAVTASGDFTEFEDQPLLEPGGAEVDPLSGPEPVPYDGTSFLAAFPDGVKLVRGNLDAGDIDAYEVQLEAGDLLLAALFDEASGSALDLVLGIFSGGVTPALTLDDDGGRGFHPRLGYVAPASGAVQVGVSGFADQAFDGTHGEAPSALAGYELVLAVAKSPAALQESDLDPGPQGSNDTLPTADLLPPAGAAVAAELAADDVDYFAIDLEEGDRLLVAVFDLRDGVLEFARGERSDPVLGLFDPLGTLVTAALDDDAGPGFLPSRSFTVPTGQGGRWSVAVSGFADAAFDGSHDEEPFDYVLVVARDRSCPNAVDPITGVSASTMLSYEEEFLEGGDHYYTDRTDSQSHVLVDVPEPLECSRWIKTPNDDKVVTVDPHLTITVDRDVTVYVGYDTRATAEPAWLTSGFTPLPLVIDIADPDVTQEFDVLRRDFPAGAFQLGGNRTPPASGAGSNYVVVVKPVDTADPDHAVEIPPVGVGTLSVTVEGVVVSVSTAGEDPGSLAMALANAINTDPTLQALRVFGLASGDFLVTTGTLEGLEFAPAVPVVSGWVLWLLAAALGAAGLAAPRYRGADRRACGSGGRSGAGAGPA